MDITKIKNSLVVSSNDLVHAKYDLSLWQKRVFVYAISQLEKEHTDFEPIKMNIKDIIKFFKASDGALVYNAIIEAPKSLDKTIEIPYITPKGFLRYGFIKLIKQYTIPADEKGENQYIEIEFNDALKPHLLELKEKFLKYDIRNVIDLQSTYSFRMYEILKSHEYQKSIEFEIEYLRAILEVKNIYKSYKDFKRRIIEKAQQDLAKFCDISFSYVEKKGAKGKKIESLVFQIRKNELVNRTADTLEKNQSALKNLTVKRTSVQNGVGEETLEMTKKQNIALDINHSESDKEKLILELSQVVVMQFGVSLKIFMALFDTYTEKEVRQAILVSQKALETGKVSNVAGFFIEALRGGYQDKEEQKKMAETQKLADKKAKVEAINKAKQIEAENKNEQLRFESERKLAIVKNLIHQKSELIHQAVEQLKNSMFGRTYDASQSIEANIAKPMLAGGLMNILQKLEPHIFD
jgi:plasmid replication initiation protein